MDILLFNIEGYRRNRLYLQELIEQNKPSLIFLQEVWLASSDQRILSEDFPEYNFLISTPDMFKNSEDIILHSDHVWHGAAVAWHTDLHYAVTELTTTNDRFAAVILNISSTSKILAISLYAPTSGKDNEFLECLSFLEDFIVANTPEGGAVLIGTDSNCSSKSTNRRQLAWSNFCKVFSLSISKTILPTFHHHNGSSESTIDYFLSSSCILNDLRQVCTLHTPLNLSSHDPLIASLSVQREVEDHSEKYSHTYDDFERRKISWDESKLHAYMEATDTALTVASEYWNFPEAIPHLCSLYSSLLVRSAEITMDYKSPNRAMSKRSLCSKKVEIAKKRLKNSFRKWKSAGSPKLKSHPVRALYLSVKYDFQRLVRREENLKIIKHNNFIMGSLMRDKNRVYSRMKQLRGQQSSSIPPKLVTPVGTFVGDDVLEGFAADAEHLRRVRGEPDIYDNEFYRLCRADNSFIFQFKGENAVKIPRMSQSAFEDIISKKMKHGKACDLHQLTVEHLQYCGEKAKLAVLNLLNKIIDQIYYMTCPQLKSGLGTPLHKGKKKPIDRSESYRRITVTPLVGGILDRYIDPITEAIFRPSQSPDQFGFTKGISYLLASVLRGECQRWAIDRKLTCYGVSLDGEAAFPSVDRDILVMELYSAGEQGAFLE